MNSFYFKLLAFATSSFIGGVTGAILIGTFYHAVTPEQFSVDVSIQALAMVIVGGLGSIKGTLISAFMIGQVVSIGSLIYAPLAQMAPFAMMLLILLVKPTGLYGSALLKR